MRQRIYELKTLICENGEFCDATMNILLVSTFGGIMINSISALS